MNKLFILIVRIEAAIFPTLIDGSRIAPIAGNAKLFHLVRTDREATQTMFNKPWQIVLTALVCAGSMACQTKRVNPIGTVPTCETTSTQEVNLDSTDIVGFSAEAALNILSEPVSAQATYLDESTSSLTISISYTSGAIQLVEQAFPSQEPDWYPAEICANHINIPATLTIISEDGVIDLAESVNLKAYRVDQATVSHEIVSSAIVNLLEASSLNPTSSDRVRYYLDNTWDQGTITGDFIATIEPNALSSDENSSESTTSISMNYLARW